MRGLNHRFAGQVGRASPQWLLPTLNVRRTLTYSMKRMYQKEQQQPSNQTEHSKRNEEAILDKQRRANVLQQIRDSLHQKRAEIEPAVKKRLEELGKRWNEYSGYEEVTEAKAQTIEAEMHLKQVRELQSHIRKTYMESTKSLSSSRKTLNDMTNRRSSWTEEDISAYSQLLRDEHTLAKSEREAEGKYEAIERQVNEAWDDVVKKTLERYHLEQVWSDRVRAGSTYGGLIVAGLNAFLIVEPYKRKKLAQTFEARLLEGEAQHTALLSSVVGQFEDRVLSLQGQNADVNKALHLLLAQAGLHLQGDEVEESEKKDTVVVVPPTVTSPQSVQDKRRDMALAGGLGFAIGAGILAAMGALAS